jgi:hypothetical protein
MTLEDKNKKSASILMLIFYFGKEAGCWKMEVTEGFQ